ncbi:hypothetical protein BDV98DRAFT_480421, partial [Pterulicium gracile]
FLVGPGTWKSVLHPLLDANVQSFQDPYCKQGTTGCIRTNKNTVDREQVIHQASKAAPALHEESLEDKWREHQGGTSQTRKTLSWIW